jgi:hypothetical protein
MRYPIDNMWYLWYNRYIADVKEYREQRKGQMYKTKTPTMQDIRDANPTFFSRSAKKFHGTTKYTKRGLEITCHNTFVGSNGSRNYHKAIYKADPVTLHLNFVSHT